MNKMLGMSFVAMFAFSCNLLSMDNQLKTDSKEFKQVQKFAADKGIFMGSQGSKYGAIMQYRQAQDNLKKVADKKDNNSNKTTVQ